LKNFSAKDGSALPPLEKLGPYAYADFLSVCYPYYFWTTPYITSHFKNEIVSCKQIINDHLIKTLKTAPCRTETTETFFCFL